MRKFGCGCFTGGVLTLVLLLAVIVVYAFFFKEALAERMAQHLKAPGLPMEETVDYGLGIKHPDGTPADLAEAKGQTIFLTFWDPECVNCLAEFPSVNHLYETLKEEPNLRFYAVAVGHFDEVAELMERKGYTIPSYFLDGERPAPFNVTGTPATFIIDANEQLVFKHVGSARWDDPETADFLRSVAARPRVAAPEAR